MKFVKSMLSAGLAAVLLAGCGASSSAAAAVSTAAAVTTEPAVVASEAPVAAPETVSTNIQSSRDVEVPAVINLPAEQENMPLVVMCHGHGGSKEENGGFDAIAEALAADGIAVVRVDYPGCGASTEDFTLNTLTNMEADTASAVKYMEDTYSIDTSKVGIFGYSMGGRIALDLLASDPGTYSAVCLLAPAADYVDLKELFGGAENWDTLKATADANGYADYTTIYGQQQKLSKDWFSDLESKDLDTVLKDATANYSGPSMVIHAVDDAAVHPEVSEKVAEAMGADVVLTPTDGHGYGFYGGPLYVRRIVVENAADFFAINFGLMEQ